MTAKMSRLNLRISEEMMALLEELRERSGARSISDQVREVLEKYTDDEADSWNSGVVSARIPNSTMDDVETLIMAGDAVDMDQAVNFALNDWISKRKEYHLQEREILRSKVGEIIEERVGREKLKATARQMSSR